MSEVLKRPTADETDEDLLQMQEEYLRNSKSQKSTVEIHKMRKRTKIAAENSNPAPKSANLAAGNSNFAPDLSRFPAAGNSKFELDLDQDTPTPQILFPVRERPLVSDPELKIQDFQQFSSEDGFPEPLDLSDYYAPKSGRSRLATPPGKSFFAAEFDRIHGNMAENLDHHVATTPEEENDEKSTDFHVENEKYLKSLDPEKILELKLEISERFDPKLLDFLKNRHKNAQNEPQEPKKVSKFKASRMAAGAEPKKEAEPVEKGAEPTATKQVEEMMNELEVLEEWKDREDEEKYNRLATDAIQLDLTAKFSRNLAQRQQKNAVKLFDNCKFRPEGRPLDPLLEQARSSLDQIKQLYLEEVSLDQGATVTYEFGAGLNPILDQCWCLVPIRRVLDAVEKRQGHVAPDDVEIIRLAVLWTLLLYSEKKSAFFAFAEPSDFYVRLSEVYLIGPEILSDDVISAATSRLLKEYVLENAKNAKISIRLTQKIAGLDAFMPFFEQMLKNYEQYSMGDANFAQAILIGAYLNAPIGDR
ncbi:hypothetical protein CAEBREN_30295 [Caenorhabditis brenneri]|uniref:Uncharacterized protein n=1 Tax=Caenorhabditis brenneri TaxID=135651 RepID=G0P435_CAEBE|nr:hypothetical protein CAEBREN_30295 [Caenorhabditis brenneri]